MTQPTAENLLTPREFAARMGYKPNYGNQLAKDGRLVFAPDGKHVLLAESIARFEATKDPSRQGVADRHAAARAGQEGEDAADHGQHGADVPAPGGDTAPYDFQNAKAKREHFAALEAEASYRAKVGELLEASEVKAMISETLTTLRMNIEGLAHRLAPALAAEVDEAQVSAMLSTEIRHALGMAADSLSKLGKK